ncbi:fibronectin type III, partial [Tribonema minus]
VTWTAPASNNAAISQFRVAYQQAGTSTVNNATSVDGNTLTLEVTGLAVAQNYTFQVFATNAAGEGAGSAGSDNVFIFPAVPGAPTGLSATAMSPTTVGLSWTAPVSPGHVVTSYVVEVKAAADSDTSYTAISDTITGTTVAATGLAEGTSYLFRVKTINQSGESDSAVHP